MGRQVAKAVAVGLLLTLGAAVGGCGDDGSVCAQATRKLEDCGADTAGAPDPKAECSGRIECISKCVVAAPCDHLRTDPSGVFPNCIAKCD